MRSWFWRHCFCFVWFGGKNRQQSTSQEDLVAAGQAVHGTATTNPLSISDQLKRSVHDDSSDDDEDAQGGGGSTRSSWLNESLSSNGHLSESTGGTGNSRGSSSVGKSRSTGGSSSSSSSSHLQSVEEGGLGTTTSSNTSINSSSSGKGATKSILVPNRRNIDGKMKKSVAQVAASADLDNERYVRFGE